MKILILTYEFGPNTGGIGKRAFTLAEEWTRRGLDVTVLTSNANISGTEYKLVSLSLHRHYIIKSLQLSFALWKILKRTKIDKVFCISWSPDGLAAFLTSWIEKFYWVVSVNGFDICDAQSKWHIKLLAKLVFNRADFIVAPSGFLKNKIKRIVGHASKISIVSNGVNLDIFNPPDPNTFVGNSMKGNGELILLSVCRLHPIKGIDLLIEAYAGIVDQYPNTKLLIAGTGPQKVELQSLIKTKKVQDRVVFLDWVNERAIVNLYISADIVIQPSRKIGEIEEGQGLVFLEAAACGKPVVGTKTGGIPEVVKEGETGLLAISDDIADIQKKILYLIQRPELREIMGRNGYALARAKFDQSKNAETILKIFR
ncbi:MAG: glycosyltransferase family 4 protein [Bacteroidetes bacterium]|nr:glycosyltransferase family 4 protein [Bacteroidota bacterium]